MKNIFFSLIFVFCIGCNTAEDSLPAPQPQEPIKTPATAATNTPAPKLDYDAINKGILKDVSKKVVDKAASKE